MTDIKISARDQLEDTKLITPAQARVVLRVLRAAAEEHDQRANDDSNPDREARMRFAARASALRLGADQIGDLIQDALSVAEAEQAERQAELERRKAEQAEREERARAHAEAYRNRPIKGLREGDVLVEFPPASTWRHAPMPAVHIGYVEDGIYLVRCGAHDHATYSGRKSPDFHREATCKRCIAIAKKEGLL